MEREGKRVNESLPSSVNGTVQRVRRQPARPWTTTTEQKGVSPYTWMYICVYVGEEARVSGEVKRIRGRKDSVRSISCRALCSLVKHCVAFGIYRASSHLKLICLLAAGSCRDC